MGDIKLLSAKFKEFLFYISVGVGIAINTSSFIIIAGMFEIGNLSTVIISVCLAGFFCIIIANSVSELSQKYPSSPGVRTYFKKAFSDKFSLFLVYLYLLFVIVAGAVESSLFANVYSLMFPSINPIFILTSMLAFIVVINLKGLVMSRNMQILSTVILMIILLFLGLYGINKGSVTEVNVITENLNFDSIVLIPAITGMAIFLFIGFEWVAPLGLSRESYQKRIPISMKTSILINIALYSIFIIGLSSFFSPKIISENILPQVKLSNIFSSQYGNYITLFMVTLCTVSTFNAGIMGGSRLIYALARERKFPEYFIKISFTKLTPYAAILFLGITVEILSIIINLTETELLFATSATIVMAIIYASILIANNKLRDKTENGQNLNKVSFSNKANYVSSVLLLIIGVLIVFSIPGKEIESAIIFLILILIAVLLSNKYSRLTLKKI